MPIVSGRVSPGPAAGQAIVAAAAGRAYRVRAIHLSVPSGQDAQINIGAREIASTEGSLSMVFDGEDRSETTGAANEAITIDSSGAASYVVLYDSVKR